MHTKKKRHYKGNGKKKRPYKRNALQERITSMKSFSFQTTSTVNKKEMLKMKITKRAWVG